MTGTTIAQAIPIAVSPLLTRIYTPEDFGVFALFIALVSLFSSIASARYEFALMLTHTEEDAINVFSLGFIIIIGVVFALLLIVVGIHDEVVLLLGNERIGFWLYLIPLTVLLTGFFNLLTFYHNRRSQYKTIASATVIKSIVSVMVQIVVGLLKPGAGGLISGQIIAQGVADMKLMKDMCLNPKFISQVSISKMRTLAKKYKDFPKFQAPHAFLNASASNVPVYLFSLFFSASVVGLYALSTRMMFAPLMIISGAVSKIYNQKISELYHHGDDAYEMTIQLLKSMVIKMIIPFMILVAFAPDVFSFVFGEEWREAGRYTQVLSLWIFLNVLVSTVSFIPSLINQQKKAFVISIVQVVLLITSISFGAYFHNIYLSLWLFSLSNASILLYNLSWMLNGLKIKRNVYGE